jgi:hypothetical protein
MNNHYHLFLQTPDANLSKIMKYLNESYARYFLGKYPDKDGHVFKGRYKRKLVQDDFYSRQLSRYIHLNPVKACIVSHPHEWKWSSYNSFIGLAARNKFLSTEWLLKQFSKHSKLAREKMLEYTYEDIDCCWDPEDYSYGKTVLGSKDFFHKIINENIDQAKINESILAASEFNISKNFSPEYVFNEIEKLDLPEKTKVKVVVYYLKIHTNLTMEQIGQKVNKSSSAVSKIFLRVKNKIGYEINNKLNFQC